MIQKEEKIDRPFTFLNQNEQDDVLVHLSSYLRWVYDHNPDFLTYVTMSELVNVWSERIEKPHWMTKRIEKQPLEMLAHAHEFLHTSQSVPYLFSNQSNIQFITPKAEALATEKQIQFLKNLIKSHPRPIHYDTITKKEATKLIDELLLLRKKG